MFVVGVLTVICNSSQYLCCHVDCVQENCSLSFLQGRRALYSTQHFKSEISVLQCQVYKCATWYFCVVVVIISWCHLNMVFQENTVLPWSSLHF